MRAFNTLMLNSSATESSPGRFLSSFVCDFFILCGWFFFFILFFSYKSQFISIYVLLLSVIRLQQLRIVPRDNIWRINFECFILFRFNYTFPWFLILNCLRLNIGWLIVIFLNINDEDWREYPICFRVKHFFVSLLIDSCLLRFFIFKWIESLVIGMSFYTFLVYWLIFHWDE